jgi:hypothetical protein
MYDAVMRVLLISGRAFVPRPLRDILERGSTSLFERHADELRGAPPRLDVDRVVFWAGGDDEAVRTVADAYVGAGERERRDKLVFVTDPGGRAIAGLSPDEQFVWPRDEDRLRMAFMTGA